MSIDELTEYGMKRMDDDEIRTFLTGQGSGVLGLSADDAPYLVPLSFGFDGESRLYFTYALGSTSQKETLTDRADTASFLVYSVEGTFNWESVLLTGTIEELPEAQWPDHEAAMENAWHPDLLEAAHTSRGVKVYALTIDEQTGIKHTGLPPGFEPKESADTE